MQNKVYVKNNATLTIAAGTIIRGDYASQGTLIITKGAKLIAEGTVNSPIVFTSNEAVGNRAEGDWGGVVLLGKAVNNQPGGIANIEGIAPSADTEHGGTDDNDNSGSLKYVRIEFAGIPLQPNKEINGLTFGSIGNQTQIDFIQVSFSGDDSYEWFGGTVDCRHLIAYRGLDDDFDTDFGFRGRIQFGLIIRDKDLSDAAGDSNSFESDNDATGSGALPQTAAIFSNITTVGALGDGTIVLPIGETFSKAFRIRRNSSISVFNSLVTGWEKGLSVEGTSTEDNFTTNDSAVFANNTLAGIAAGSNAVTAANSFYSSFFSTDNNDSTTTVAQVSWVNIFATLGTTPDARLTGNSSVATGASFTDPKFQGGFIGIEENSTLISSVGVFPNPATEQATVVVNLNESNQVTIELYDLAGKKALSLFEGTMNAGTNYVNFSSTNLNAGIYTAVISTNGYTKSVKLVVSK